MSFFACRRIPAPLGVEGFSLELLHGQQCAVCTLNHQPNLRHPNMEPFGSEQPLVYFLGEAPGETEDRKGRPFVGKAGQILHFRLPDDVDYDRIRWNNCVRTRPPNNRDPTLVEIECCRPSIIADIERTKPKAIFGFGNIALHWAIKQTAITRWRGRRIPIQVGNHKCWFFPMLHPSYIAHNRKFEPTRKSQYGSEDEFAFDCDLRAGFAALDNLPEPIIHSAEDALADCRWVTGERGDLNKVEMFLRHAAAQKCVGFDLETKGTRPYAKDAKILSMAFAAPDASLAFAVDHKDAKWSDKDRDALFELIAEFFRVAECRLISHYLAFEMEWVAHRIDPKALRRLRWADTLTQAYTLDERAMMHSLDILCLQYFGLNLKAIMNLDPNVLDDTEIEQVLQYNALDAKYHLRLYHAQLTRLKEEGLLDTYKHLVRRVPTCVLTQLKGVPVDQQTVRKHYVHYSKELVKLEAKIQALPIAQRFKEQRQHPFRPSAPFDIKYVVTKMLGHAAERANEEALLQVQHPIAKLTLQWRKVAKLRSTYVLPYVGKPFHVTIDGQIYRAPRAPTLYGDGLIHQILATTRTDTTRTSSLEPNMQNSPKRNADARRVRSQVRGARNQLVVAFDYAGIQARNIAMESKDKELVRVYWERYDVHTDWLNNIVKLCPQWVEGGPKALKDAETHKYYRDIAKNKFVFPSFFGARPQTVAGYLKIDDKFGEQLQEMLWDKFPDIHGWHNKVIDFYKQHGYVTGWSGVRRHAPISPNQLINAPIQADEALIVLEAMSRLSEMEDPRFQANLEIHDDLTFIWDKNEVEKNSEVVITEMLRIEHDWINVPLGVERSIGEDWASLKKAGEFHSDEWKGKDPHGGGSWADEGGYMGAEPSGTINRERRQGIVREKRPK